MIVYKNDVSHKPARVTDAIADWTSKTRITFKLHTTESNYVEIVEGPLCSSLIGMQGGRQQITLAKNCTTGSVIHEIGHTVGLFHEQARLDRESYVKIIKDNIETGKESQFDIANSNFAEDLGDYDYGSIMHYGAYDFSRNGKATIETIPPGIAIGQRDGLSAKDIASVAAIYGPRPSDIDTEASPRRAPRETAQPAAELRR